MSGKKEKELVYLGKVLQRIATKKDGSTFETVELVVDNPLPVNKDGSPNAYFKGQLIYRTADGSEYIVKQAQFKGVTEQALEKGFTRSLAIDINNKYSVEPINKQTL